MLMFGNLPPEVFQGINSAVVISANRQTAKPVHNLGWLLRNWRSVESFHVCRPSGKSTPPWSDAVLVAHLKDGRAYATPFASTSVLRGWLCRPVFLTLPCIWFGVSVTIDKATFNPNSI